ncbi:Translin [Eremomyces bilateralis CBS 781.70]|uniref:Translin n=1 Tax=Eremomyces bilateralis CBS 781.70 TaxID=1392243 RepID=A0A6G1GAW3_9PEZI|nr:Translin [Eremomyces bilateralis CBS 781.70]KAF1815237.1 Translin [Eremomyces bilateralis CBS 781.70]
MDSSSVKGLVDPAIFDQLQRKIDEDAVVQEGLREIVDRLEKQSKSTKAALSKTHAIPSKSLASVIQASEASIRQQLPALSKLVQVASQHPYYRWNGIWSRQIQDLVFDIVYCGWLGGFANQPGQSEGRKEIGKLLTIDEVADIMQGKMPANLKDRDEFHLTIEEYLHALLSLIEELSRLARNSVTLGDYERPQQISRFIKDLHSAFLLLNLKNDALRKRSDGIKYKMKEVEDVVYDLTLRNLLPKSP